MLVPLNLKKTLEKNIDSNNVKNYFDVNPYIVDLLEFSTLCTNCEFLLQGRGVN